MKIYYAYGLVSAAMLLITILFYSYKNWLALRKNSIYICLLLFAFVMALTEIFLGNASLYFHGHKRALENIAGVVVNICMLVLYLHIFLYDMAVTRRMRLVRTGVFRIFLGMLAFAALFSIVSPFMGASVFSDSGVGQAGAMGIVQAVALTACLLAGMAVLLRDRRRLSRREFCVLFVSQTLLLADVNSLFILKVRNAASCYILTGVLISYYILLHNMDQYRSFSSRCFDRAGFHEVLLECACYKESFACLGICINNIESITNFCTEAEIAQLHQRMGKILRKVCGRHNVYHIHSFEYMIMLRGTDSAKRKHQILEEAIPSYFRINNKNISILCGFYTVEFADAGYDMTEFNRTIASMRKLTMEQMSRDYLLYYEGESQTEIQNELESLRVVNHCIAGRRFDYVFAAIQSRDNKSEIAYELILKGSLKNGTEISQEQIWSLAAESGYSRELGYITFEMLCRAAWENGMLEDESIVFHVNLLSGQLTDTAVAEEYIRILKSHSIPGKRVCIELTTDLGADYGSLAACFDVLHEYGITLLLDQFGVTVCNLKNVLNMSFDSVKINHHMVRTFCDGRNSQLVYLVRMLNARGWTLYLDGIDDIGLLDCLKDMKVDYIQGLAIHGGFVRASVKEPGEREPENLSDSTVGGEPVRV